MFQRSCTALDGLMEMESTLADWATDCEPEAKPGFETDLKLVQLRIKQIDESSADPLPTLSSLRGRLHSSFLEEYLVSLIEDVKKI